MSDRLETVKIVKDHAPGYAIINKSDFDPKRHQLYDEAAAEAKTDKKAKGQRAAQPEEQLENPRKILEAKTDEELAAIAKDYKIGEYTDRADLITKLLVKAGYEKPDAAKA